MFSPLPPVILYFTVCLICYCLNCEQSELKMPWRVLLENRCRIPITILVSKLALLPQRWAESRTNSEHSATTPAPSPTTATSSVYMLSFYTKVLLKKPLLLMPRPGRWSPCFPGVPPATCPGFTCWGEVAVCWTWPKAPCLPILASLRALTGEGPFSTSLMYTTLGARPSATSESPCLDK